MAHISQRNSNIELLRIISMLIIVAHHFAVHSGFVFAPQEFSLNAVFIQLLSLGGKMAVNVFVLISGYFLIKQENISVNRIMKIWGQICFYSVCFYLFVFALGFQPFSIRAFLKSFFPIVYRYWWFASVYFVLYLFSPFINAGLMHLSKQKYLQLLLLMTAFWSVIPTVTKMPAESNDLLWFIYLYCLAGYIRLFGFGMKWKSATCLILAVLGLLCTYGITCLKDTTGTRYTDLVAYVLTFLGMQEFPILIVSILLFLVFANMNLKYTPWINKLAAATFGVYLIHDIPIMRDLLWKMLLHNADHANAVWLIPYSLIVIVGVFLLCSFVELIRIATVEKVYLRIVSWISDHIKCISNLH